ncbi:hypothetical protein AB9F47_29300 [Rhizobium leguminosarum]|uniref:hypothetical protein n=1 Tax=Rhizobium leguminosarum TaxID=384 RepID=UPI003F96700F
MVNIGLNQLGRFRLCTPYSVAALTTPIEIGPGKAEQIDTLSTGGPPKVFASVTIRKMEGRAVSMSNVLIAGDLTIAQSRFVYVDISNSVIMGNLKILGNTSDIHLERLHVLGDIAVVDNTTSGGAFMEIRSLGSVQWSRNTYVKGDSGFFSSRNIDVDGGLAIEDNKVRSGTPQDDGERFHAFLSQIRKSYDDTATYRSRH